MRHPGNDVRPGPEVLSLAPIRARKGRPLSRSCLRANERHRGGKRADGWLEGSTLGDVKSSRGEDVLAGVGEGRCKLTKMYEGPPQISATSSASGAQPCAPTGFFLLDLIASCNEQPIAARLGQTHQNPIFWENSATKCCVAESSAKG